MTDWANILFKAFWCGWAAVGFGILFNVPAKSLISIWTGGALAGVIKFSVLFFFGPSIVIQSSFYAALAVGVFSIPVGHFRRVPPMIFAIPSVIPLIPGVFAYHTMLGLIKLTGEVGQEYDTTIFNTIHDGVTTLFIIMAIALGGAIPMHIARRHPIRKTQYGTK